LTAQGSKKHRIEIRPEGAMKKRMAFSPTLIVLSLMLSSCVIVPKNSHVNLSADDPTVSAPAPSSAAYIASTDIRHDVD